MAGIPALSRPLKERSFEGLKVLMSMRIREQQTRVLSIFAVAAALGLFVAATPVDEPVASEVELVVDPNIAPPEVLAALPRLGPVLVGRIVDARSVAPFASLSDLGDRVRGIGPATIPVLRPHLRVGIGPTAFPDP